MILLTLLSTAISVDKYGYRRKGSQCCIGKDNSATRPSGASSCFFLPSRAACENWAIADPGMKQSYWRCQWDVNAGTCVDYCGQSDRVVHDKHCLPCCVTQTCGDAKYDCKDCECGADPVTGLGPASLNQGCCGKNQRCVFDHEYKYHNAAGPPGAPMLVQQVGRCCNESTTGIKCSKCALGWHGSPTDVDGCRACPGVKWDPQTGDTTVCSGHGQCVDSVEGDVQSATMCECDYGFGSADCSVCSKDFPCANGEEIKEPCSGRGLCTCANNTRTNEIEQSCKCNRGFMNDHRKLSKKGACNLCSSRYVHGTHCQFCNPGSYLHTPATLTTGASCTACDCSGHGSCSNVTGDCYCDELYSDPQCGTKAMSNKEKAVLGAVGGSIAAIVLLVIVGVVAGCFIDNAVTKCKQQKKKAKKKAREDERGILGGGGGDGVPLGGAASGSIDHSRAVPGHTKSISDSIDADDLMASMMTRLLDE